MHFLVQVWVGIAAADVVVDYGLQVGHAAVVHIGGSLGDVAQSWSLERSHFCSVLGLRLTSRVGEFSPRIHADADVMELIIREEGVVLLDRVAYRTVTAFGIHENLQTALRGGGERFLIAAIVKTVKGRVAAQYGALERSDRLR